MVRRESSLKTKKKKKSNGGTMTGFVKKKINKINIVEVKFWFWKLHMKQNNSGLPKNPNYK